MDTQLTIRHGADRFRAFFGRGLDRILAVYRRGLYRRAVLIDFVPARHLRAVEARGSSPDAKAATLVASMVALFGILPLHWFDSRFHFAVHRYDCRLAIGELLREHYPGKSVMTGGLGKVPFLADSYTVDFYGLIDPVVSHGPPATREFDPGHVKFNLDYSLARKPDVIVEAFSAGGSLNPGPGWDLEERYEEAGYRISYLVSDGQTEPAAPIICTENMPTEAVQRYIGEGYTGAVIVRDDSRRM